MSKVKSVSVTSRSSEVSPTGTVKAPTVAAVAEVTITIPVITRETVGYLPKHVQAPIRNVGQRTALRDARIALNERGARMVDGRYVQTNADVIRYMLDQIVANR